MPSSPNLSPKPSSTSPAKAAWSRLANRFVIPGRILRLNADLSRLKQDEPIQAKRSWFNEFLEEKLARSRLRYYEEPVILMDE
ncbi:MAG: hypothetical protein M5U34_40080 [Chloroflexi bacterium]|nr:hypothetical protein [Chloroflexota bacterium]